MQISTLAAAESSGPLSRRNGAANAAALLLPGLDFLPQPGVQTQNLRDAQHADDRTGVRRDRRAADASGPPDSLTVMRQAERDMTPGSAAFARQQRIADGNRDAARQQNFQQALQQASDGRTPRATPRSERPAVANDSGGGLTPPSDEADSLARPAETTAKAASSVESGVGGSTKPEAANPATSTAVDTSNPAANASALAASQTIAPTATPAAAETPPSTAAVSAIDASAATSAARGATTAANRTPPASAAEPAQPGLARPETTGANGNGANEANIAARNDKSGSAATRANRGDAGQSASATGNDDPNVERIVRLVANRVGKDVSVATLRLDPPWLGSIRMHIDLRDSQLNLRVEPESQLAHRLLSENVESLRRSLEAAGIHLAQVDFAPPADAAETGGGQAFAESFANGNGSAGASGQGDGSTGSAGSSESTADGMIAEPPTLADNRMSTAGVNIVI